jgi:hypothetical protein
MHIFLIGGRAQNGKDSLADIMIKKLEGKSIKIAMADYLKFMAAKYYGWNGEKDEKGRTILQWLGTDKIRDKLGWDTFHVERVCQDIKIIEDSYDYVFIPDARFKNEMYYTQAKFPYNTTTIHIERIGFKTPLTEEQQKHKSENDLKGLTYDYEIKSENGLDKLENQVDLVLGDFIKELNKQRWFKQYASY